MARRVEGEIKKEESRGVGKKADTPTAHIAWLLPAPRRAPHKAPLAREQAPSLAFCLEPLSSFLFFPFAFIWLHG